MRLSVVVTVVDGGAALRRCLEALSGQHDPPDLEVLIPFDRSISADVERVRSDFPEFRFMDLGVIGTKRVTSSHAGRHELYDRRRSAGLAAATGDLVAIVEDRGIPDPDWARAAVRSHELPVGVIGGAVEFGGGGGDGGLLAAAVYFCDFGRYQLPFEQGPATWVTDVNVCYKGDVIRAVHDVWRERYHEPMVHGALLDRGEDLWLTPRMVVRQVRDGVTLAGLMRERFQWGRLFAYTRTLRLAAGAGARWLYAVLSPLLPVLLFMRLLVRQIRKRSTLGTFLLASPAVVLLLVVWSLGELVGYVSREP